MVDFATSVVGILAATLIPAYISLYLVTSLASRIHVRYIAAIGVGLTFWYFFDTLNDAAQLDVNSSFGGGLPQLGLIVAFVLGLATLAIFDHFAVPDRNAGYSTTKSAALLFLIPAGIAIVTGIHGLGEGWDFGSAASQASNSLVDAFGGLSAVASYPLHKFLESAIIAAAYAAYLGGRKSSGGTVATRRSWWHLPVLGLFFGIPGAIGTSIGYFISLDTTYFFAFGVTSAIYAALRLVEAINPSFKVGENAPIHLGWKVFLAVLIGFFLLYSAALLH
ncbi:MAG TPA: hypothetical protein VFF30_14510 [Nitrososphaerales archaeon]|nr:hypothetical protein [Nitrososphaerales archaeon]